MPFILFIFLMLPILFMKRKNSDDSGSEGRRKIFKPKKQKVKTAETKIINEIRSDVNNINSIDDCIYGLKAYIANNIPVFKEKLVLLVIQAEGLNKRKVNLKNILDIKFMPTEIIYINISSIIQKVEIIMIEKIKILLNILWNFDEREYEITLNLSSNNNIKKRKENIFEKYNKNIADTIELFGTLLTQLDEIQLEISDLAIANQNNLEENEFIDRINNIIGTIKKYK
jgi:hypothetical protein